MHDDIVTRLGCAYPRHNVTDCGLCTFCLAKADIERLRTENARLWEADPASDDVHDLRWQVRREVIANHDLRAVLNAIDALHQSDPLLGGECAECFHVWPCPTARLLHPEEDE